MDGRRLEGDGASQVFDNFQKQMSQVGVVTLEDFIFGGAPQVLSRYFQGNSKVWPSLFVCGYYLTE